jgi:hypothetical protein
VTEPRRQRNLGVKIGGWQRNGRGIWQHIFPIILQRDLIIAIDFITRKRCMCVRGDTVDARHTERECLSLALWG